MQKLAQLAFRNIFRNKRRTIITEVTIIVGMMVIIFVSGLLKDMEHNWRDSIIYSNTGHVQIMATGLNEEDSINRTIPNRDQITGQLAKYPEIESYTSHINIKGLISNGEETQLFIGAGIDPASYLKTLPNAGKTIKTGQLFQSSDQDGAVIGEGLAKKLKVTVDDTLILAANDKNASLNAINIKITGIASIAEQFTNDHLVLLHIDNARILASYTDDEISKLVIKLKRTEDAERVRDLLQHDLKTEGKFDIFSWHSLAGNMNTVLGLFSGISAVLTLILMAMTLIGIMNTVLMSVFERMREMGTLMAIGSSPRQVISLFIWESLFIGIIGVGAGIGGGILVNTIVGSLGGVHFPPPPTQTEGIVLSPVILPDKILMTSFLVLIASILAALYPARHAAKQRPVEALRAN